MDLETIQPLDWLLKKDKFYLLAHFWQQVSQIQIENTKFKRFFLQKMPSED